MLPDDQINYRWLTDYLNSLKNQWQIEFGDKMYPVGSIFTNASNALNPADILGFGTWTAFGAGRVLVGKNTSGTFQTIGATGGAETHTLQTTEIPSHQHGAGNAYNTTSTYGSGGSSANLMSLSASMGNQNFGTGFAGGGGSHNNLQPYIVVYMWQRTA
jgi:hypothetical protein